MSSIDKALLCLFKASCDLVIRVVIHRGFLPHFPIFFFSFTELNLYTANLVLKY